MRPTLVTGANGHVGNNICRLLVQRGEPVRAMMRATADPAPLHGLDVEIVYGDILDAEAVARAVEGCARVYHTAAGFLMWAKDPEHAIIRPSVDGTRNVMKAAAKAGVEKVLYVSTGGTIGFSPTPDTPDRGRLQHGPPHAVLHRQDRRREGGVRDRRARAVAVTAINPGPHPGTALLEGQRIDQAGRRLPEPGARRSTSRAASASSTSRTSPTGRCSPWTREAIGALHHLGRERDREAALRPRGRAGRHLRPEWRIPVSRCAPSRPGWRPSAG